ncbi:MAG: hypothetical protein HOC91_15075 [Nitrospinaceae bacterium]|jgi:hypothetical protein|nr:hypothetical protein [Nitrospinaceae bacterium]MBT3435540.1 hypothetical protein [Nitrospinaceae bacterium]MBT3822508.1 hypothetical protein [Nitrospinaceae bacterium]MBT4095262.1 hypothetical protein [Nitrospinaceae bacterium]MBT4431831.1 hypothetical protein [Nitrospinaceae bacterium]
MLKRLWEGWKRVAKKIARFNSLVICTILYIVILPLAAIPFRLFKDPLRLSGDAGFIDREQSEATMDDAARQG